MSFARNRRRLSIPGRVLVVVLSAWALATVLPDLARVSARPVLTVLPLEVDNGGTVVRVDAAAGTAAAARLRPGTRIALRDRNCRDGILTNVCRDLLALYGGSGGIQYLTLDHPDVTVRVLDRGRAVPVTVHPVPYVEPLVTRAILAIDELCAVLFIALSALMVWRSPSLATCGFFAYALWYNPGQTYVSYAVLQTHPLADFAQELLQSAAGAAGIAGFILFALRFPDSGKPPARGGAAFLIALTATLLALQIGSFLTPFGIRSAGACALALAIVQIAVTVGVIVALVVRRRFMMSAEQVQAAQRTRLVYYALTFALPPFLLAEVIAQGIWVPHWIPDEAGLQNAVVYALYLPSGLIPLAVFEAVRRLRVVDIRFTVSRAATLAFTSALWLLLMAAAEHALTQGVESIATGIAFFAGLAVVTALFERIRERLNEICDKMWFRRLHLAEELLQKAEDEMQTTVDDVDHIERMLVERPAIAMQLASAAVFRRDGASFTRTHDLGWDGCAKKEFAVADPVLAAAFDSRDFVWPEGVPRDAAAPALVLPVARGKDVMAVALYGAHALGDDLVREERDMLVGFVRVAGPAFREAMLAARIAQLEAKAGGAGTAGTGKGSIP